MFGVGKKGKKWGRGKEIEKRNFCVVGAAQIFSVSEKTEDSREDPPSVSHQMILRFTGLASFYWVLLCSLMLSLLLLLFFWFFFSKLFKRGQHGPRRARRSVSELLRPFPVLARRGIETYFDCLLRPMLQILKWHRDMSETGRTASVSLFVARRTP